MSTLRLPRSLADEMIAHARREAPNECCGILAGQDGAVGRVFTATNIDRSPVKYTIDPKDMDRIFREAERDRMEILAFYHSHTFTEAYPSVTDVKLAPPSDLFDYLYLIVSLADPKNPVIRSFRIADRQVEEMDIAMED